MERDIAKIAKTEYLLPVIQKQQNKAVADFNGHLARYADNLQSCMEWGSALFEAAAMQKIFGTLTYRLEAERSNAAAGGPGKIEWTRDELRDVIRDEFRHTRALPGSSSASHNLAEATLLQAVLDMSRNSYSLSWFYDAQYQDPEWKENADREWAAQRAEKLAQEAAFQLAKKAERKAKRDAKKS
jgi:hypothetical protein